MKQPHSAKLRLPAPRTLRAAANFIFKSCDLTFSFAFEPLRVEVRGGPEFESYRAGTTSDRFKDMARSAVAQAVEAGAQRLGVISIEYLRRLAAKQPDPQCCALDRVESLIKGEIGRAINEDGYTTVVGLRSGRFTPKPLESELDDDLAQIFGSWTLRLPEVRPTNAEPIAENTPFPAPSTLPRDFAPERPCSSHPPSSAQLRKAVNFVFGLDWNIEIYRGENFKVRAPGQRAASYFNATPTSSPEEQLRMEVARELSGRVKRTTSANFHTFARHHLGSGGRDILDRYKSHLKRQMLEAAASRTDCQRPAAVQQHH